MSKTNNGFFGGNIIICRTRLAACIKCTFNLINSVFAFKNTGFQKVFNV